MGMVTEIPFARTFEPDEIDRAKMRKLAILLTKIARRLLAEEKEMIAIKEVG